MDPACGSSTALGLLRSARRIGLALSGGSMRCAFQVGVIETLEELGIRPALCVAVSGGVWNAAAVAAGTQHRLRRYWRAFIRMPRVDLANLAREHSPYRFTEMHRRTFPKYVGVENLHRPEALPLWIGVSRLRDRQGMYFDARTHEDPLTLLLASNYLPPLYTHAPRLAGERYGDGGLADNLPYRKAFEEGCDAVVLVNMRGESEGLPYRNPWEPDHEIPSPYRERTVMIRPRHRLLAGFTESRWPVITQTMDLGRLRAREELLGEIHPECNRRAEGGAVASAVSRFFMTKLLPMAAPRG